MAPAATASPSAGSGPGGSRTAKKKGVETRETLSKQLAKFKEFQTGLGLAAPAGYRLVGMLASGAQGDVFEGVATSLAGDRGGMGVCLKRVRATSAAIVRHTHQEFAAVFHARARYAAEVGDSNALGHPNMVGYLDWFYGPAGPDREVFLVMQRCEFALSDIVQLALQARAQYERKCSELLASQRHLPGVRPAGGAAGGAPPVPAPEPMLFRFPCGEVVRLLEDLLSALVFLNRHGVLHRDIKADNILWAEGEPEGCYKLADFGAAAVLSEGETSRKEQEIGTLWTMPPEVIGRRSHSFNCDVWSLACVVFEAATLEKLFNSKELLAYKNSPDAIKEGSFWPAITGFNGGNPASAVLGGGGGPSPRTPCAASQAAGADAPSSARGGASASSKASRAASAAKLPRSRSDAGGGTHKMPRGATKQACSSLPVLSPGGPRRRRTDAAAEASGGGGQGGDAVPSPTSASAPSACSDPSLPRLTPRGSGASGASVHAAIAACSVPSLAPSLPSSPKGPDALRSRKHAFLRKRGNGRWGYSEELRALLFEDMLEEDACARPTAAEVLVLPRASALFKERREHATKALASGEAEPVASLSSEAIGAKVEGLAAHLRVLTPEGFVAGIRIEKERLAAEEAQAAGGGGADPLT
eukprot:TRINITY_DN37652_c0_g1_i1.p1 TRINITY_DN37652_c0_g1~~TRINITY_DN37652_c0_g1_i1.p1  ORF type:complete len:660 (+),score=147.61 TRINITY_DN37652_c0_g1_i1:50-1981(+)